MDTIKVRISAALEHDYSIRLPEWLPLEKLDVGMVELTRDEAIAVMNDAAWNGDKENVEIGGMFGMPIGTFNAYKTLAQRIRKQLDA